MNERKRPMLRVTSELVHPPAFHIPGNRIFERIGAAVSEARGYLLGNQAFARLIGRSESTTSHWFGVFPQPHLVSFFCLLEQLPPLDRKRVIDELCRDLPLFDHPRLKHNPIATASLKNLLKQKTGLSLLVSGTDEQRTFVLTALGHTFCRLDEQHRTAAGIDVHDPEWFVPIETLLYLKGPANSAHVSGLVRGIWPEVINTKSPLVLLNGIWSAMPELRRDILSLARRKHVIVADQQISVRAAALGAEHPCHTLTVSTTPGNQSGIDVRTMRPR